MKSVKRVNYVYLFTVLLSLGLSFLAGFLSRKGIDIFMGSQTVTVILSQAVFILPTLIYLLFFEKSAKNLRFNKINFSTALLCVVLYICLTPVLNFLNYLSMLYSDNRIASVMGDITQEVPFAAGILCIAIIPAFCEELTYRGVFYGTYRQGSSIGAVILSGLTFGMMHGNLNQFTYAMVLGMCFALIVEATDSIWSTMIIHCLVNAFSTTILYLLPKLLEFVSELRDEALLAGDTQTITLLENLIGSEDMTMEGVLGQVSEITTADKLLTIRGAIIPAIIGGILAFLLYRAIARRCGRWNVICEMFGKKSNSVGVSNYANAGIRITAEGETAINEPSPVPEKIRLVTWPLVAGMVILLGEMLLVAFAP